MLSFPVEHIDCKLFSLKLFLDILMHGNSNENSSHLPGPTFLLWLDRQDMGFITNQWNSFYKPIVDIVYIYINVIIICVQSSYIFQNFLVRFFI